MTTRRDLLKLGSSLGLIGPLVPISDRMAAARVLDVQGVDRLVLNPADFASTVQSGIEMGMEDSDSEDALHDWYGMVCPEEHSFYRKAHRQLDQVLKAHGIGVRESGDYDAATMRLMLGMYDAGVRHGAAYESLRRSVVGNMVECRACRGLGVGHGDRACGICGGNGTVALKGGKR